MPYYNSPRWTNELADCSMPMTFDTYSNCSFGCKYCFSMFQRANGSGKDGYIGKEVEAVNVDRVKRLFTDPDNAGRLAEFAPYIKDRRVMQWGGLSDQFDGFERKYGKTLELLRFFKEIDYPLCFSTKSVWWTKDERYMGLFRGQKNWNVKFSIITLDEAKAKQIEVGVPSPSERLEAIERITAAGAGGATLRLRPFIIGITTPTYLELIRAAHDHGATAMSTEFFCVEQRSNMLKSFMPLISKLAGYDVMKFYKEYSVTNGYLRLNRKVKARYMLEMRSLCNELGMRYYVSDAHFKELCDNGSCCGLPVDWNYSRGQWCEALQIAKERGMVSWNDVSTDIYKLLNNAMHQNANGFNNQSSDARAKFKGMTLADYMRWLWNNPQAGQSPYRLFEGALIPECTDSNGNIIYRYGL